jgi:hypothetical protein
MRYACLRKPHDRCPGGPCDCLCHLRSEALAACATLAFGLLRLAADGVRVPMEVVRAQQTIAAC